MSTQTVQALLTDQHGSIELAARPRQPLGPDEVRISVAAATINPIDDYVINGFTLKQGWSEPGPLGLGWDVAGIITELGTRVDAQGFDVGTRVAGLSSGAVKEIGGQAEEVVLPFEAVAAIPDGLEFAEAASLPLNTLTADLALHLLGPATGALLVTGVGGGVGGYAAPLAQANGWRVLGLGRPSDQLYADAIGVELITELPAEAGAFDAVIDAANLGAQAAAAVRSGGALAELVAGNTPATDGVTIHQVMVGANRTRLAELLAEGAAGTLPVRVRATHRLDEADKAYAAFRGGGRGRVVLVTDLVG